MYVVLLTGPDFKNDEVHGPFFTEEDANQFVDGGYKGISDKAVVFKVYSPAGKKDNEHIWAYDEGWVGRPSPYSHKSVIDHRRNRIRALEATIDTHEQTIKNLNAENERLDEEVVKLNDEIIDWENARDRWVEENQRLREDNEGLSRRLRTVETHAKLLQERVIELTKSTDDVSSSKFSGENRIDSQEDLHWSQAYPEHYGQGEKEDPGWPAVEEELDKPDPNLWEQEPRRQWYVIKLVHYITLDESDGEEWQGDLVWGPYPSRERAENVLNIQARRCAELGWRAKFTITEEI